MTNTITIDLPADPEEAVRLLRHELRFARRRLALARQAAAFSAIRMLAGTETSGGGANRSFAPATEAGHGAWTGMPR